ncbi:PEP-CTERM protein-sorting domain-containing protein [Verrucomicrobium sp. GAS474]|uniref:choice-of-anchor R domain-containing protein n=1 Tax=Verrucomicrobium sp. GAS474 TaxID=1882831 RepID=UPI00087ACCB6|nr:choice-of-anchor R domain-containing protein [Verrucomicrobium sp. GAS474]SDT89039.1 PEP-CTERM protein-sorting domain-containing protein [Verrucomicrobium sp. GAS474]
MKIERLFPKVWAALLLLLAIPSSPLHADIVIGNLADPAFSTSNNSASSSSIASTSGKAVGFTLGSLSFTLTAVKLRLAMTGDATTDLPSIQIFAANGTSVSTTVVATLTLDPGNAFTYIASNTTPNAATGFTTYTFDPATTVTLSANTAYFLVVRDSGSSSFTWAMPNTSPSIKPTSVNALFLAAYSGANTSPSTWTTASGNYNWMEIDGTAIAVPEPSLYLLILLGLIPLSLAARRRREQTADASSQS